MVWEKRCWEGGLGELGGLLPGTEGTVTGIRLNSKSKTVIDIIVYLVKIPEYFFFLKNSKNPVEFLNIVGKT